MQGGWSSLSLLPTEDQTLGLVWGWQTLSLNKTLGSSQALCCLLGASVVLSV